MTVTAFLPTGGLSGWTFLKRTKTAQLETFAKIPAIEREISYFREQIENIRSAQELVSDRRLLGVSLGAFGLSDDLNNRFFIQKILEEGTATPDALAIKLSDTRYRSLASTFGFDRTSGFANWDPGFVENLISRYTNQSFEEAVGQQDQELRLSLNAQRELGDLASEDLSEKTKWYRVMGSPPLREVFEIALGLPQSFGEWDIDKQLEIFRDKTEDLTGEKTISQFKDEAAADLVINRYLLMSQLNNGLSLTPGQIAISLLQAATP
ncbi:DUF1217 domain-containing protein [Shimia sp. SDUM112013]|uniref:DUF1217 domain-containing protein n=1 Tax=Shimia sp. SDUM112013 TaxID=3136160 RepID=UPI0032EF07C1